MTHLYIHIPFCQRRCAYCDFTTYAQLEDRIDAYVTALCAELRMLAATYQPSPPASPEAAAVGPTLFFGGGTPTMLNLKQFERILNAAAALVCVEQAEISSEANPGTLLNHEYLCGLRSLGVNRLSLGVQSLNDATLRRIGRIHDAAQAFQSYQAAREAGFAQINLDLIFGLPGQSLAEWQATLAAVMTWAPEHLALYALIVETTTPLYTQVTSGQITIPDDDTSAAMYEMAMEQLAAAGYVQYEISNWARSGGRGTEEQGNRGTEMLPIGAAYPMLPHASSCHMPLTSLPVCRHNLAYWLNSDYTGAGAGAHGHSHPRRYANLCGVDEYIAAVGAGRLPIAEEVLLTPQEWCAETMIMGMRLNSGVSAAHFAARCGRSLEATYGPILAQLAAEGLIERNAERVWLSPRGRMLGNQVCMRFV
ncbi:radical SAM family heme chaperone HemW [Candidatus Viridilinea mediisalina]|uniref:Heme chaperone HemW n=1 Tax=Candidatus Viridilinea mediisalina TaxID=2024553 RepID=A0A2A6RKX7_9CHLR|nr:radical SAM family heme chaperone HemW [Candidatus Viridilinea mediisalina]PDW03555.1 coproporphyrinogen III oxidase [Candidatus Viridilinea mediisalina]